MNSNTQNSSAPHHQQAKPQRGRGGGFGQNGGSNQNFSQNSTNFQPQLNGHHHQQQHQQQRNNNNRQQQQQQQQQAYNQQNGQQFQQQGQGFQQGGFQQPQQQQQQPFGGYQQQQQQNNTGQQQNRPPKQQQQKNKNNNKNKNSKNANNNPPPPPTAEDLERQARAREEYEAAQRAEKERLAAIFRAQEELRLEAARQEQLRQAELAAVAAARAARLRPVLSKLEVVFDDKAEMGARVAAANELVDWLPTSADGLRTLFTMEVITIILDAADDKKLQSRREGACIAISSLCRLGATVAPFVFPLLPVVFELLSDRVLQVRNAAEAALKAAWELQAQIGPQVIELWLPILFAAMTDDRRWQTKLAAHKTMLQLCESSPTHMCEALPRALPNIIGGTSDMRSEVALAATQTLDAICRTVPNPDIEPFIPVLVNCMIRPGDVSEAAQTIAATTFVSPVTAPCMAILVPVLERGLRTTGMRSTVVKRQCAVIADSMAKLVEDPYDAHVFLPTLLPWLERAADEVPDPECRDVAARAVATLRRIAGQVSRSSSSSAASTGTTPAATPASSPPSSKTVTPSASTAKLAVGAAVAANAGVAIEVVAQQLTSLLPTPPPTTAGAQSSAAATATTTAEGQQQQQQQQQPLDPKDPFVVATVKFVAALARNLVLHECFDIGAWNAATTPYMRILALSEDILDHIPRQLMELCKEQRRQERHTEGQDNGDEDEEGEDLCNCTFSLAYGSKVLLNNTRLRLKRGRRYGLVGPNGSGKSTLLTSISNGQLDGFPPADVVRTVYVLADIQAEFAELNVLQFIASDPLMATMDPAPVVAMLESVGFTPEMRNGAVSKLSGGWRMKLALARAMLKTPDVLLLDEPTNHLDVTNVAWLEQYLNSLSNVTCIIVSHDSSFLDNVCTDVIRCDYMKLRNYRGNLSEFVKRVPEAKSYYELKAQTMKFNFPEPGFLEGVKSKTRTILRMDHVGFTYPGSERQVLRDVSIAVSMASRCAVVGPNGAGKSTMIKLLIGELYPDSGEMWKHGNLRVGYIAQHAFHHIENHLNKTPNEYIRWRYEGGEDKEAIAKATLTISDEELELMKQPVMVDKVPHVIDAIVGRRQVRSTIEYEVRFEGKGFSANKYFTRGALEKMGWKKMCMRFDEKEALRSSAANMRPLSMFEVEKHLRDMGLEAEFASHTRIISLSTSQKVKVVFGAALWNCPHILVLDEPTNYLDRESLGALATAIREFGGGVIMISHHTEFTGALCPETWFMRDGLLHTEGASSDPNASSAMATAEQERTRINASGNEEEVKGLIPQGLSRKDARAFRKRREERRRQGLPSDDEDD